MRAVALTEDSERDDPSARIARLVKLGSWIPTSRAEWRGPIEALFETFLQHCERATLSRLLEDQLALPARTRPAERLARLATGLTALHKVCQILARNRALPEEARAALAPLERLPGSAIPDMALAKAAGIATRARPGLRPDPAGAKVGRGSVADVFRFRGGGAPIAFKTVRPDALPRIQSEADILKQMADESAIIAAFAGPDLAHTIAETLRDAARALLREIDFPGEVVNLRDAAVFYRSNRRIHVPKPAGPALDEGLFMEFAEGTPLLETSLDQETRRQTARVLYRSLILEPLFSGLDQSIFHADPHAGNILARKGKNGEVTLVLLDWSQADRLPASLRQATLELCLCCLAEDSPPPGVLERILGIRGEAPRIPMPAEGDPLHKAFAIVEQLATQGNPVPLSLLLLRKAFLTLEGIALQLDPSFDPWRETLTYGAWVIASEAPFRAWSIPFPWLDEPAFYRSGLSTRVLAGRLMGICRKRLFNKLGMREAGESEASNRNRKSKRETFVHNAYA